MEGQSVSLNQAFRERIRSYMKGILIFNSCKLAAALGALIAAIFIKINVDKLPQETHGAISISMSPSFYVLPCVGAAVTILTSAVVVYVFTSDNRKEHFISNVILYRIVVLVCQIPLVAGFGTTIYFNIWIRLQIGDDFTIPNSVTLPPIMYLVFSGLILFFFGIGSAICMRRIYIIKFFMFLTNTATVAAARPNSNLSTGFGTIDPKV